MITFQIFLYSILLMSEHDKKTQQENQPDVVSFSKNYRILEQAVAKLQNDANISVDDLLPLVDDATAAYHQCKQRLQMVEEALEKRLQIDSGNSDDSHMPK